MGLLETTAELAKLASQIANPELLRETMKANTEALAISKDNLDLQRKIGELESQVKGLQRDRDVTAKVFRNGQYVYVDGDPIGHCSLCWDSSRKLIHLLNHKFDGIYCPSCQTYYAGAAPYNLGRDDQHSVPAL